MLIHSLICSEMASSPNLVSPGFTASWIGGGRYHDSIRWKDGSDVNGFSNGLGESMNPESGVEGFSGVGTGILKIVDV